MSVLPVIRFSGFFDRAPVVSAMDKAKRRKLSRAGAFIRQRARSSIRKRNRVSAPGSPPSSHVGTLKKLIFFTYDRISDSVVVGPLAFQLAGGRTGAQTLEFGGEITFRRQPYHREWSPSGYAVSVPDYSAPFKTERFTIEPRPYMGPAFDKEYPQLALSFRDSMGGG